MEREKNSFDANCETDISNLQKTTAELIAYVELKAISKKQDSTTALRQSQNRLLKYKELLLHAEHIEESELLLAYIELSKIEKSIAQLGLEALSISIDVLDKALSSPSH